MQAVRSEIQMNVYDKGGIVCLIKLPDDRDTRILTSMGMRVPCHCNAAGKVLLAYQKEEEISRVLQGELKRYTPKTITSAEKLRAEIEKIRKMGYAVSDEEYREELFTIAAPVFDSGNHVVAAVSVTRPKQLVTSSEVEFIVRELKTCSRLISEKLEIQAARRRQKTEK
jgi:DNA-binding IclR family transcriptional regulator